MTLTVDFSGMDKKFSRVISDLQAEAARTIKETGEQAIKIIVQRTRQKSKDKDGRTFKPYSQGYLKQRRKAGATTRVVLTSAGSTASGKKSSKQKRSLRGNAQGGTMLNSLTIVRTENRKTKVVISSARRKELIKLAGHVRGEGSLPIRNPLGFTPPEEAKLVLRASRQILTAIRRAGLA